jgi:pimeloyl-ACP methyl ester carboxylesterase
MLAELLDAWGLEQPCIAGHDIGGAITLRLMLLEGRRFSPGGLVRRGRDRAVDHPVFPACARPP